MEKIQQTKPFEKYAPKLPEWLNIQHPDFPEYFELVIYDEQSNPKSWFQRLPKQDDLYQKNMITDLNNPCCKCQSYEDSDGFGICKKQIPPYYRGGFRIRNSEQDSCSSFTRKM